MDNHLKFKMLTSKKFLIFSLVLIWIISVFLNAHNYYDNREAKEKIAAQTYMQTLQNAYNLCLDSTPKSSLSNKCFTDLIELTNRTFKNGTLILMSDKEVETAIIKPNYDLERRESFTETYKFTDNSKISISITKKVIPPAWVYTCNSLFLSICDYKSYISEYQKNNLKGFIRYTVWYRFRYALFFGLFLIFVYNFFNASRNAWIQKDRALQHNLEQIEVWKFQKEREIKQAKEEKEFSLIRLESLQQNLKEAQANFELMSKNYKKKENFHKKQLQELRGNLKNQTNEIVSITEKLTHLQFEKNISESLRQNLENDLRKAQELQQRMKAEITKSLNQDKKNQRQLEELNKIFEDDISTITKELDYARSNLSVKDEIIKQHEKELSSRDLEILNLHNQLAINKKTKDSDELWELVNSIEEEKNEITSKYHFLCKENEKLQSEKKQWIGSLKKNIKQILLESPRIKFNRSEFKLHNGKHHSKDYVTEVYSDLSILEDLNIVDYVTAAEYRPAEGQTLSLENDKNRFCVIVVSGKGNGYAAKIILTAQSLWQAVLQAKAIHQLVKNWKNYNLKLDRAKG